MSEVTLRELPKKPCGKYYAYDYQKIRNSLLHQTQNWWLCSILTVTMILSILYMLRWMQSIYFAKYFFEKESIQTRDIRAKEILYSLPLIVLIFWLGLYPGPALQEIEPAAKKLSSLLETPQ